MAEKFLTVGDAAKRLGRSVQWVYKLLQQGRLRHERFGAVYQIYASSVEDFTPLPVGKPPAQRARSDSRARKHDGRRQTRSNVKP